MYEAAATSDVPPTRISFVGALKILRLRLAQIPRTAAAQKTWWQDLIVEVGTEIIPPRRDRNNARVIKRKMSKWKKKRPKDSQLPQPDRPFLETILVLD